MDISSTVASSIQSVLWIKAFGASILNAYEESKSLFEEIQYIIPLLIELRGTIQTYISKPGFAQIAQVLGRPLSKFATYAKKLQDDLKRQSNQTNQQRAQRRLAKEDVKEGFIVMRELRSAVGNVLSIDIMRDAKIKATFGKTHKATMSRLERLLSDMQDVQTSVNAAKVVVSGSELVEIMGWIGTNQSRYDYEHHLAMRTPSTTDWFYETPAFKSWRDGASTGSLWCTGDPGSGKSVLSASVVEHLKQHFDSDDSTAILFAYFRYNDPGYRTLEIAKDLLQQLIQRGIRSELCASSLRVAKLEGTEISLDKMGESLLLELQSYGTVYLVLDGLDEAHGSDSDQLFNLLSSTKSTSVKILATSQNEDVPTQWEGTEFELVKVAAPQDAIEEFARGYVRKSEILGKVLRSQWDIEEVLKAVVSRSASSFLLAKLHLRHLESMSSRHSLLQSLHILPSSIQEAYGVAVQEIQNLIGIAQELAFRVISCILSSLRPLTVFELRCALLDAPEAAGSRPTSSEDELESISTLMSMTQGLVVVIWRRGEGEVSPGTENDQKNAVVECVHYTAHEYLKQRNATHIS